MSPSACLPRQGSVRGSKCLQLVLLIDAHVALLILLAGSAWAEVVRVDFLAFTTDGVGCLLLAVELVTLLLGKDRIPLRKTVEPACLRLDHVVVQGLRIDLDLHLCILIHGVDRVVIAL